MGRLETTCRFGKPPHRAYMYVLCGREFKGKDACWEMGVEGALLRSSGSFQGEGDLGQQYLMKYRSEKALLGEGCPQPSALWPQLAKPRLEGENHLRGSLHAPTLLRLEGSSGLTDLKSRSCGFQQFCALEATVAHQPIGSAPQQLPSRFSTLVTFK